MKNLLTLLLFGTVAASVVAGCGEGGNGNGNDGSGGATEGSGGSGSGGVTGTGGKGSGGSASGGASATGGSSGSSSGGVTGSGGKGSGGVSASGGALGSGGATAAGGSGGATGGMTGTGGALGSGGAQPSGGSAGGGAAGHGAAGGIGARGGSPMGGTAGGAGMSGSYHPCPTSGEACKILPLGDSITYGLITVQADKASSDSSINGKDSHGGYRVKLFADAVAASQKITFTGSVLNGPTMVSGMSFPQANEGHSGYTIDSSNGNGINVKALLDRAFQTLPQIILLHIGTNDVYASSGQSGMADRLTALIDELVKRAPDALIVVSTIIPLKTTYAALGTYNGQIPGVVSKEATAGHHVVMVDIFSGFDLSLLSGDGVHPNQMGYDRMGDKFYAAVSSLLPN